MGKYSRVIDRIRPYLETKKVLAQADLLSIFKEKSVREKPSTFLKKFFGKIGELTSKKMTHAFFSEYRAVPIYIGPLHDKRALADIGFANMLLDGKKEEILEQKRTGKIRGIITTWNIAGKETPILVPFHYVKYYIETH